MSFSMFIFIAGVALVGLFLFWRVARADRKIVQLRLDVDFVKRRTVLLEKQIGWDGDKAFTIMFERNQ